MFNDGADIHTTTAAQVYDREPEDVTKQMRYGPPRPSTLALCTAMGPHGLAQGTGMDFKAAQHFIERYFEIRPKLKFEFIEQTREQAKNRGTSRTFLAAAGRRRTSARPISRCARRLSALL
jgi:DNA polymerase-1